MVGFLFSVSFV